MNTKEAAEFLGLHPQTLKRWRQQNYGPAWHRLGRRLVLYKRKDLESFINGDSQPNQPDIETST